jgi:PAB-dependent poly(A)-specific ribonuclease subunit 3
MSDTLREDLQRRSEAIYSLTPRYPSNNEKALPEDLHVYHSLVPLEPSGSGSGTTSPSGTFSASAPGFYPHTHSSSGGGGDVHKDVRDSREQPRRKWFAGFSSMVYKATNREDGSLVALRRIEGLHRFNVLPPSFPQSWFHSHKSIQVFD